MVCKIKGLKGATMTSEAQKRTNAKYDAIHTKQLKLKLNTATDADILEWLENMENKQGYIKDLIRADIKGNK